MSGASRRAPARASRRAGPVSATGVLTTAAAPALSAAPEANTKGSSRRASCQTGTAVFVTRAAVYVDRGSPSSAAIGLASRPQRGNRPSQTWALASAVVAPLRVRFHEPTLMGEVTLNI